ncbi:alpha/beta hydrolase [Flavobacteriaceae bacterium TP-CH-4]|uniref:Alpha/beta hydrolase n=1 Tax=Pelagihabitans pacificus TaxID=2696054 RepID=A0A967ASG4_9FLAO|nr:alpha/beta hydrolase [Pelagihabitans pacificus]NHF59534.1 alpha/beta hydrolase [Pelagihabitans pacificus]
MRLLKLGAIFMLIQVSLRAQDTIMPLWPQDKIPNRIESGEKEVREVNGILRISKVQQPSIEVYLPAVSNATGEAMLIFPGGGYGILAYDWEGTDIAKFLNGKGIAGIVVKYRLPSDTSQEEKHLVPLIDAQRAMRLVRSMATDFHIEPDKIGIIGFSAGGHLASTLGTHFNETVYEPMDAIDAESARPDFMALGYAVITFGETSTHKGSQYNLLGENPPADLVTYFSNEKQVTENTPPSFLFHAMDDEAVPVGNSLDFLKALKDKGVPATLHVYPKGGHGFSLARKDSHLRGWTERMFEWMEALE